MAFYPLAGLMIGLIVALGHYLFSLLLPGPFALWLTIGLLAILTGGLHLDGFADTLDGLASRGTREKMLEVMKDSRIGAFGVMGLIFLIGAKYLALSQISVPSIPYALMTMAVMGRNSMVLVCYRSSYARSVDGLARPFTRHLGRRETAIASITALGLAVLLMGLKGIVLFLGACLFSLAYRLFFIRRLGGVTGDILGAANEWVDLLCLVLFII